MKAKKWRGDLNLDISIVTTFHFLHQTYAHTKKTDPYAMAGSSTPAREHASCHAFTAPPYLLHVTCAQAGFSQSFAQRLTT